MKLITNENLQYLFQKRMLNISGKNQCKVLVSYDNVLIVNILRTKHMSYRCTILLFSQKEGEKHVTLSI